MSFAELSIEDFAGRLASGEPTPGGGAAAALVAQLAASLVQMVARHTLGRPRYAAVEPRMQTITSLAEGLGRRAAALMDADATAFEAVAAAFKLPREQPERTQRVNAACRAATETPLEVLRICRELADMAGDLQRHGNRTLENDARAALLLAQAAAIISAGNVRANRPYLLDSAWAEQAAAEAAAALAEIAALAAALPPV